MNLLTPPFSDKAKTCDRCMVAMWTFNNILSIAFFPSSRPNVMIWLVRVPDGRVCGMLVADFWNFCNKVFQSSM